MTKHSKHYYEYDRNMSATTINPKMLLSKEELASSETIIDWQEDVIKDRDNKWKGGRVNPDYSKTKTPNYYIGGVFGYQAKDIIEDFDLSYNVGTCLSYIVRAKRKHDSQTECIQKAINHLEFELERLKRNEKTNI